MKVVRTMGELETAPGTGLVPTMGALHEGHRALFRAARAESERVVASLFVNPAQFDEQADLEAYPRDEEHDLQLARAEGVDVVFAPAPDEMYPGGFATWVDPQERKNRVPSRRRSGASRRTRSVGSCAARTAASAPRSEPSRGGSKEPLQASSVPKSPA